jgi:hypothetical protein
MRRILMILAAAIASALTGIVPAAAVVPSTPASAGHAPGGWSVAPSPNPQVPTGQLFWVSCPAANSCMAVGTYTMTSGVSVNLAERWNGSTWRIVPTPNPRGIAFSGLLAIACTSPSACTAVGGSTSMTGQSAALAERWNGVRWRIQPTPRVPKGGVLLTGVSCASASACTAVGGSAAGTLAESWDGTAWHIQTTPSPPGGLLNGVSCTSPTACVAVGGTSAGTLAETWNGASWSIQATPTPSQGAGFLDSVSCVSSSTCTATGSSNAGTLAEAWNGASWQIQSTASPAGAQFAFLNSVACTSTSACTGTGGYLDSSGVYHNLAEEWTGASWQIHATPDPKGAEASFLIGVTCTSAAACIAVGYGTRNQTPAVTTERWDGSSWRIQSAPDPVGAGNSELNAVACTSPSGCVAVGSTTSRSGAMVALAEWWNGHAWRIQPIPSPAGGGVLFGVSCAGPWACSAVGNTAGGRTLAEWWDGRTWRIQPTPSPAGGGALNGVSCTSARACTAVGNSNRGRTLAERWNGARWRMEASPNRGSLVNVLAGVACTSPSACMAVGGRIDSANNAVGTLAERWNGRRWRIVPTFKPTGNGSFLSSVDCTSTASCVAVGSSGPVTTLAEYWNGARWSRQHTPNPPGSQNIGFSSVSCSAATACTAFGLNLPASGPLTLAERWNGRSWRIQPTPAIVSIDTGPPGVACPTRSTCFAVSGYTNQVAHVTLVERWSPARRGSAATVVWPAARYGVRFACGYAGILSLRPAHTQPGASLGFCDTQPAWRIHVTGPAWP